MAALQQLSNLPTYEMFSHARAAGQHFGALAKVFWSNPAFGFVPGAGPAILAACGELAERTCARMTARPEWGIRSVASNGNEFPVLKEVLVSRPFCELIAFRAEGRVPLARRVLLVAPLSGHHPTLLRETVKAMLPECDVFLTEWRNARDVPVSEGGFDVEDFTLYIRDFMRFLGRSTHVIAVCQPAPLALAATAELARAEPEAQPLSLVLIGGPVVPGAAPTEVTEFGDRVTQGQIEHFLVQRVGSGHAGEGRLVFPGSVQIASFLLMNADLHMSSYARQMGRISKGLAADDDRHNKFYDEYLAVMDMPAEFYISTVNRLFKDGEVAHNRFTVEGRPIDLRAISETAVMTVEGGRDDISAPGQSSAVLPLLTGIPESMKSAHVEPDAGHYGIFSGTAWRDRILPVVLDFVDSRIKAQAKA